MLDDDKGVHLVAAVNLAESIPECSLVGLEICRELITKQVGCVIGMASGSTFCGVVGSSNISCRWDIAGPPPVRAARLMQYALLTEDCNVAIDQSVYDDPIAFTRMTLFDPAVNIKGTLSPIPIYTLSNCQSSIAFRVLETVHGMIELNSYCNSPENISNHSIRSLLIQHAFMMTWSVKSQITSSPVVHVLQLLRRVFRSPERKSCVNVPLETLIWYHIFTYPTKVRDSYS